MPSRNSSRSRDIHGHIDKLDFDSHRNPQSINDASGTSTPRGLLRDDESLLSNVVDGIIEMDRQKMQSQVVRYLSFASALMSSLCAGSIITYSVYGHLFISNLHYTQIQVNTVSIAAELGMYLPVSLFGYLCDRFSPRPVSFLSALLFGFGYLCAALTYHQGAGGWPFGIMVLAFVAVGMGTSCMYMSAVTTCAKNFGRGKHQGLALAVPIAAFGLSGMWQSQVASQLLYEKSPNGGKGDVDVFRYFLFLSGTLFAVGLIGAVCLRIVDEGEIIDEAVEELERSGLLEDNAFFQHSTPHKSNGYGTINDDRVLGEESGPSFIENGALNTQEDEEERKKSWLLKGETRRFLGDHTMWSFAAGFFLVSGAGEAFINNLGTMLNTLYPPNTATPSSNSPSTNISIVAATSTIARLLTGTLCDLLAPAVPSPVSHRRLSHSSSALSLTNKNAFTISRVAFLIMGVFLLILADVLLASPLIANHPGLFPVISALAGTGYGVVFSLTPIIISVVWGVQSFGTNWGIIAITPAAGAIIWSAVYSVIYQKYAGEDGLCYGLSCFSGTFWAMAACGVFTAGLWLWTWRGRGGWLERGIAV